MLSVLLRKLIPYRHFYFSRVKCEEGTKAGEA